MLKNFRVNQWMSPRSSGCRYGAQGELHIVALLSYMTYILYAKYISYDIDVIREIYIIWHICILMIIVSQISPISDSPSTWPRFFFLRIQRSEYELTTVATIWSCSCWLPTASCLTVATLYQLLNSYYTASCSLQRERYYNISKTGSKSDVAGTFSKSVRDWPPCSEVCIFKL